MRLKRIELTNYRCFESASFDFGTAGVVVRGENGRGKSNLLESIFFLAVAKSGRGARDREIVRWDADHFVISANLERGSDPVNIRIAYDSRAQKKRVEVDETTLERLSDLIGQFNAVLFSPEDVDLVLREASERRRLLDILVSQSSKAYLADLENYRRILAQRNHLLRTQGWQLKTSATALVPWDHQLAEAGSRVIDQRVASLDRIKTPLKGLYDSISPRGEVLDVVYRSPALSGGSDDVAGKLVDLMEEKRVDETKVGYSLVGPHRDHVIFNLDGHAVHKFGSKGQMKSVLLAWKLAEADFLKAQTGFRPVLLMDDIFSELDDVRANSVLDMIGEFGQCVLATARDPDLELGGRGYESIDL